MRPRVRSPYHGLPEASTPGEDAERDDFEREQDDRRQLRLMDRDEDARDGADDWRGAW